MVAAFQVDANNQRGQRRLLRARQLRRRHQRRRPDLRPQRRRHLRPRRQPRADDDLRRRGQRHVPGRPGLPVARATARTRTTASTPIDFFQTTLTTRGYLSNGISEDDDDLRRHRQRQASPSTATSPSCSSSARRTTTRSSSARSSASTRTTRQAPFTNINGGQGADFISYTVNAPVRIDGGDGLDTLVVVGTEFGDDFVITDKGVFGAGLFVTYAGIEKLVVDAQEGNDRFFIASHAARTSPLEIVRRPRQRRLQRRRHERPADHGRREQPPGPQRPDRQLAASSSDPTLHRHLRPGPRCPASPTTTRRAWSSRFPNGPLRVFEQRAAGGRHCRPISSSPRTRSS